MITKPQSGNCGVQRASTNYMKLIPKALEANIKSTCAFYFEAQFKRYRMMLTDTYQCLYSKFQVLKTAKRLTGEQAIA